MFKLANSSTYRYPVTVTQIGEDGTTVTGQFEAEFRRIPLAEREEFDRRYRGPEGGDDWLCDQVLVGWEGWVGEDDQPLPVTPENKAALISADGLSYAISSAYWISRRRGRVGN